VTLLVPRGIATGSYESERDDWPAAVERAVREEWRYLELTAISSASLDSLHAYLPGARFDAFERVSLHAPVLGFDDPGPVIDRLPPGFDAVLHPNTYGDVAAVASLGERAVFENMDVAKSFGRSVHDLARVLERFPEAGFCLDVAHVWTNDRSLALGHELLDAFGHRLRQLHVSGIEPDGTHRPTTRADLELYWPLLDRSRGVPWLLEATLAG
jgi:sugar phosphate isomerase/epimerase